MGEQVMNKRYLLTLLLFGSDTNAAESEVLLSKSSITEYGAIKGISLEKCAAFRVPIKRMIKATIPSKKKGSRYEQIPIAHAMTPPLYGIQYKPPLKKKISKKERLKRFFRKFICIPQKSFYKELEMSVV